MPVIDSRLLDSPIVGDDCPVISSPPGGGDIPVVDSLPDAKRADAPSIDSLADVDGSTIIDRSREFLRLGYLLELLVDPPAPDNGWSTPWRGGDGGALDGPEAGSGDIS